MVNGSVCSAINCSNKNKQKDIAKLPLFRTPKDPDRAREWLTNSGRSDLISKDPIYLYHNTRFCAAHFEDTQFTNSTKKRLIWNAVPRLFSKASDNQPSFQGKLPIPRIATKSIQRPLRLKVQTSNKLGQSKQNKKSTRPIVNIKQNTLGKNKSQDCEVPQHTGNETNENENHNSVEPSDSTHKVPVQETCIPEISSSVISDDLLEYQKKVEAFKKKLFSRKSVVTGSSKPFISPAIQKSDGSKENECHSSDGQSSSNNNKPVGSVTHTGEAVNQENERSRSSVSKQCVETKDTCVTNTPLEEDIEEKLSATCIKINHTENPTKEEERVKQKILTLKNLIKTKSTSSLPKGISILRRESLLKLDKTKSTVNASKEVEIQKESRSAANCVESNDAVNPLKESQENESRAQADCKDKTPCDEIDIVSPKTSGPQRIEHQSSILPTTANEVANDVSVISGEVKFMTYPYKKRPYSLTKSCKLIPNKTKGYTLKRKLGILKNNSSQINIKPVILKRNLVPVTLKHNDKQSLIKCNEAKLRKNLTRGPRIDKCFSMKNCTKYVNTRGGPITVINTDVANTKVVESIPHNSECQSSSPLSSVKQIENKAIIEENQNLSSQPESNSLLKPINDEFSQYKQKVEAFKEKLSSLTPTLPYAVTPNQTLKRKLEPLDEIECLCSVKKAKTKDVSKANNKTNNVQISTPNKNPNSLLLSSVKPNENQKIINPTIEIGRTTSSKFTPYVKKTVLIDCESEKYKAKTEALEKLIVGLKTNHKSEIRTLKKTIKELNRKNHRKSMMINRLRKERNDLKNCTYFDESKSKASVRRDRHFIEQTLSKYMNRETVNIIMSQLRPPTLNYGNRWDDETKLFALNIFQSSPKAYKILGSYLQMPSTRTLQKFLQGADLMALSGLASENEPSSDLVQDTEDNAATETSYTVEDMSAPDNEDTIETSHTVDEMSTQHNKDNISTEMSYTVSHDMSAQNNEDNTMVETSSVVDDMSNSEMVSSMVEVEYGDSVDSEIVCSVVEVESETVSEEIILVPQEEGREYAPETEKIIYYVPGTDRECEVITEGPIEEEHG